MTGFGAGEWQLPGSPPRSTPSGPPASGAAKICVEIRAVNHRYLDVRVRVPSQLPDLASSVEAIARERLTRGRFDVSVRIEGGALRAVDVDLERAKTVLAALTRLRDEVAPGADVPLSLLSSVPDLFVPALHAHDEQVRTGLAHAFDLAVRSLDEMRSREGASLREDLVRRLAAVRALTAQVAARGPVVLEAYRKKLRERAERLRTAVDVEIDAGRLEQELALYADRVDVVEETVRLDSHASHFEALLGGNEGVGRRLDFLLQEMAREANTIGAKSQDVAIAHAVVDLKAEIERLREQVQNVE